jgi:hypothetical protein
MQPAIMNPIQMHSPVPPIAVTLHAGPLALLFEPDTTFLRRISLNGVEILRCIYGAVRDRNWGTVPPQIHDLSVLPEKDSFQIHFGAACKEGPIEFVWKASIHGSPDGTIQFDFDGEALTAFLRNRIGLCVLHPLTGCAGEPCLVEHMDGSIECGQFPKHISPHQPFEQIRAITHAVAPGLKAEVRFEGEIFEMEDQRNWTDASFKTYCTPLSQPFPVLIEKGTRIHQSVTLRLIGKPTTVAAPAPIPWIDVDVPTAPDRDLPPVGLCLSSPARQNSSIMMERLRALSLSHLRVDLHMGQADWRIQLRYAAEVLRELPTCKMHLALFLTACFQIELEQLRDECIHLDSGIPQWSAADAVSLWLVHCESVSRIPDPMLKAAMVILKLVAPRALWAAGTNAHFAELNRNRPNPEFPTLPCYSMTPQVHASDDLSLFENLEAQPHTVESLGEFSSSPAVISPITLRPRFNAVATGTDTVALEPKLPASVDPRQLTLQGAAWTLGSLSRLCVSKKVHSLTYYATAGWHGVMEYDEGSPFPDQFPSCPGTVFPLYHVFKQLAGSTRTTPSHVSEPDHLAALTLFDRQGNRSLLLANLTMAPLEVHIRSASPTSTAHWKILNHANVHQAVVNPESFAEQPDSSAQMVGNACKLLIPAYAFARVTFD